MSALIEQEGARSSAPAESEAAAARDGPPEVALHCSRSGAHQRKVWRAGAWPSDASSAPNCWATPAARHGIRAVVPGPALRVVDRLSEMLPRAQRTRLAGLGPMGPGQGPRRVMDASGLFQRPTLSIVNGEPKPDFPRRHVPNTSHRSRRTT